MVVRIQQIIVGLAIITFNLATGCSITNEKTDKTRKQISRIVVLKRTAVMDTITVVIHGQTSRFCNNGPALALVTLSSKDEKFTLQSDANGRFKFFHIPHGRYKLTATCVGHYSLSDTTVNFKSGEIWEMRIGMGCEM